MSGSQIRTTPPLPGVEYQGPLDSHRDSIRLAHTLARIRNPRGSHTRILPRSHSSQVRARPRSILQRRFCL